ncbi:hypothetical protein [Polyangium spumosum]|uniref:SMP-30/Gluconolactonase/LRE-like region domain-containing protein n=1 Tax=Polyangium spumosum TaxID=889282 RepID=A0A6N7PHZ3_9BACT|nr:hypothetical protein [Polyangium spumosum]MRG91598.1 hypothetical protein [Polyangium spumosum]
MGALLTLLGGCSEPAGAARTCSGVALDGSVLMLAGNLQASGLGRIDATGCMTEIPDISLGADPSLSLGRGGPFVCVRDEGLVRAVDPATLAITRMWVAFGASEGTFELATGGTAKGPHNPHDADLDADGRLWVARFEQPGVAVLEPDGSFGGVVDLSAFADVDGLPEIEAIRVVGDHAYAVVERLDRRTWKPAEDGAIVVIDVASRSVVGSIDLGGKNPFGRMNVAPWDPSGKTVALAMPGDFYAIDPGHAAAIVDLEAREVQGIAEESALDGSISEVALAAPDEVYVIVAGTALENPTRLVRLDPSGKTAPRVLADTREGGRSGNFDYAGLAVVGRHVLLGDRAYGAPAIRIFERATGNEVGALRPERLPPLSLLPLP